MGCWNKTCGLSNLPIRNNEDVYVFVLRQNASEGRCYNISFYSPTLVPFECKYNDYGGGHSAHGVALKPLLNAVYGKLSVQPETEPENSVTIEDDVDLFFELAHDGELITRDSFTNKDVLIDFVMMRKDIVEDVLDNIPQRIWFSHKQEYVVYYLDNIIADIPMFIESVSNYIETIHDEFQDAPDLLAYKLNTESIRFTDISTTGLSFHKINLVAANINNNMDYRKLFNPNAYLVQLISDKNFSDARLFLIAYMKGIIINDLLDRTRKQWIPGCHEGSQACDYDGYIILNNAILNYIDDEQSNEDYDA